MARRFGVSTTALCQRSDDHVPAALVKAKATAEAVEADALLGQVFELRDRAVSILDAAASAAREARKLGRLLNGGKAAPIAAANAAPRCGARTRRGTPCGAPALRGRARCRLHGGASSGPSTKAGLNRMRRAVTRHGQYVALHHPDLGPLPGLRWRGLVAIRRDPPPGLRALRRAIWRQPRES
jgi:hypothetical protein